ncbi:hypothetical protein SAMD00019534_044980 [Acytostelium subglobosum LB1]|uniref:hypothetical protein n=1 Tax=Acytostelium subglobosum LB1 TaxID=1410327 RepID=UPI00064499FE|nr:hypothetical protein SAMD00019534_044980 [Acytostelium subglobosum LB1]GAM21323.1 hypothetical protein SAMD00019534_044980 [Acytostelium subglobosum LB1]|eukprot:XP_012755442.1 hypothetical protein SAMD00019534_044980 [Acytostelium subglobosum LB1]
MVLVAIMLMLLLPTQQDSMVSAANSPYRLGESKKCRDCLMGQLCLNNTCTTCQTNDQCQTDYSSQSICSGGLCVHKTLFHNKLSGMDILSFFLLFVGCALSSGGGIGGGGIYIPILILVNQFSPKVAIPLSNCLVAGCAMANLIQNFPRRHPHANKHLIDYSVVLLIEPLTLCGTVFGIYLHTLLPPYIILILLVLTLTATAATTIKKGLDLYRKEKIRRDYLNVNDGGTPTNEKKMNPFYDADWIKIFLTLFILVMSTMFSVFKGGNNEYSVIGVKLCSVPYWILSFAIVPLVVVVWVFTARRLYSNFQRNQADGIIIEGDIRYTRNAIILLAGLSVLAGVLASLLGIGGGMIKGPVLLAMGLSPDIVAATSSFMILFTSASSAFQYILLGKLALDYGLVYYLIGFAACFVGTQTLIWVVKKYKRRSYIVFLISCIIVISTILLVITEVIDMEKYPNQPFVSICVPSSGPLSSMF